MDLHPLKSDAPLIVYLDIKSPYGFVAVKPTLALEQEMGVRFDWRPLTLDIASYHGSARKENGRVVASDRTDEQWKLIRYRYRDARRYAERQGYMLKGTEKIWDSSIANIGLLWLRDHAPERVGAYLTTVYPPFWRRELDIENIAAIEECLTGAGVSIEGFRAFEKGRGRDDHDRLQNQLHPSGIFGVPTYVVDGEVLRGRENLPFIRWKLSGSHGPAPDIAYEA